ncbi:XdhC family protein [Erythrobacter insulae]|uniref:XdhC family protein n=1 Tax=Erythrobacter insulae TaxID=2584124 RepID=UPI001F1EF944|nr:XdhC family protein [Erythrobacter insulae]
MHFKEVFVFLNEARLAGKASVLVTVCAVEGSSMRNPGSVMGVAEDGNFAGSLSGGCIENAVVSEAIDAMKVAAPRTVRFGAGSRYLDIKLPCGGGLDLHFQPLGSGGLAADCLGSIKARSPFAIAISADGAKHVAQWQSAAFDPEHNTGVFGHWPAPKLQIIGHGAGVNTLAKLAQTMDCAVSVLTPDQAIAASLTADETPVQVIKRTTQTDLLESDPWTAFVFLFHDHDWEIDLIARALDLPHFYLGAMGGRKAHAMRTEALRDKGVSAQRISSIRAPIGVFHSSRDPQTLALSALAEVIRAYQDSDFETDDGR